MLEASVFFFNVRCSMISAFPFEYEFCCTVLDTLNARRLLRGGAGKKGIAVDEPVQNSSADKLCGCLFIQKWSNDAWFTIFQIGCTTEIDHLLAHCQTRVVKDTIFFLQVMVWRESHDYQLRSAHHKKHCFSSEFQLSLPLYCHHLASFVSWRVRWPVILQVFLSPAGLSV